MDFWRTVLRYAGIAWNDVTAGVADVAKAFDSVWRFIGSLTSLVSHLYARTLKGLLAAYLYIISDMVNVITGQSAAIDRVRGWIYKYDIVPLRGFLLAVILALAKRTEQQLAALKALEFRLYFLSLTYTQQQVTIERKARIADVNAARAYAAKLVSALHASLETEASAAYNEHTKDRLSVISKIIDEIANRNPVVRKLTGEFITLLLDFTETENPVLRLALKLLLPKIIGNLGIDKPLGDLLSAMFGSVAGTPKARTIGDAVGDLAGRVSALEGQWAAFMANGGPEIEQAGEQWKGLTSLTTSAALLGFFGLAVADPSGWATAVADTVGVAVNDSAAAAASLIRRA